MLSLFGPKLPIDEDELEWQFASFKWLIQEFGDLGADTPLVLPTEAWFPPEALEGKASARELFDLVREHAGLTDWGCELREGERPRPIYAGNAHLLRHEGPSAPAGTFEMKGDDDRVVVITYNPELEGNPMALVATFAHELAHYLMITAETPPPGGWELDELHTDLCAVYLGFGVFLANSAKTFRQFQSAGEMGWSTSTQGYLSEGALVTALAVTERLAGRDPMAAAPHLKDYLEKDLRRADRALAKLCPDVREGVIATDLSDFVGERPS